jgi:hypothetical protein
MHVRSVVITAVAAAISAGSVQAQERPTFAGRWDSTPVAPARPPGAGGGGGGGGGGAPQRPPTRDMGSLWGPALTITQDARALTVEYAFFARGDMQRPLRFNYALDGSETRNSVMMGRGIQQQLSRTAWSGDTLIITTRHPFAHPETGAQMNAEVKRALNLSADSLIVLTTVEGVLGGPATTSRTVYRKVQ